MARKNLKSIGLKQNLLQNSGNGMNLGLGGSGGLSSLGGNNFLGALPSAGLSNLSNLSEDQEVTIDAATMAKYES